MDVVSSGSKLMDGWLLGVRRKSLLGIYMSVWILLLFHTFNGQVIVLVMPLTQQQTRARQTCWEIREGSNIF